MDAVASENGSSEYSSELDIDPDMCGNLTQEYKTIWKTYEYWCEGVLFSSLGFFGNDWIDLSFQTQKAANLEFVIKIHSLGVA